MTFSVENMSEGRRMTQDRSESLVNSPPCAAGADHSSSPVKRRKNPRVRSGLLSEANESLPDHGCPGKASSFQHNLEAIPILIDGEDRFFIEQCFCVLCGSGGTGVEGKFLRCVQCCRDYHPFCLDYGITSVSMANGWRCIDCTVCTVCRRDDDEDNLLLCDSCNMSYHTRCLKPPLHSVPLHSWRCDNCIAYRARDLVDNHCNWCGKHFFDKQLTVYCKVCQRWSHASCAKSEAFADVVITGQTVKCRTCDLRLVDVLDSTKQGNPIDDVSRQRDMASSLLQQLSRICILYCDAMTAYNSETLKARNYLAFLSQFCSKLGSNGMLLQQQHVAQTMKQMDVLFLRSIAQYHKSLAELVTSPLFRLCSDYRLQSFIRTVVFIYSACYTECQSFPSASAYYRVVQYEGFCFKVSVPVKAGDKDAISSIDNCLKRFTLVQQATTSHDHAGSATTRVYKREAPKLLFSFTSACVKDGRKCVLCQSIGDQCITSVGRLLYVGPGVWAHVKCLIHSKGVVIDSGGGLHNVHDVVRKSSKLMCAGCQQSGATVRCECSIECAERVFHFACALRQNYRAVGCRVVCRKSFVSTGSVNGDPQFDYLRRYYVYEPLTDRLLQFIKEGGRYWLKIGNLMVCSVGYVHHFYESKLVFRDHLLSIGYKCLVRYWDCLGKEPFSFSERLREYTFSTDAESDDVVFRLDSETFHTTSKTDPSEVWKPVVKLVKERLKGSVLYKTHHFDVHNVCGFNEKAVKLMLESFDAVNHFSKHRKWEFADSLITPFLPLAQNPTGSLRSEGVTLKSTRSVVKLTGGGGSDMRSYSGLGDSTEAGHQRKLGDVCKSSRVAQFREMKDCCFKGVRVQKSLIHGYGLFAMRDYQPSTIMIEYVGSIIRNEVANVKERIYEKENRGVYMFRLDSDYIVDATLEGSIARFVNHSCQPNCNAEIVSIDRSKRIIIVSIRHIRENEEITYNYQLDYEGNDRKIPCNCGAPNCRRWLN